MTNKIVVLFIFLLAAVPQAWAGAGASGAQILLQELGARPAGLAGAYTAWGADIDCLSWNPAGLAGLGKTDVAFMHGGGIEGMATEWLAGAAPVPGLGTLAAQILYQGMPPIDNQAPDQAPVEVKNLVFGIAYAATVFPGLRAGANAKLAVLTLGASRASVLAFDLGAQYALDRSTRLGAAVRQLGSGVKFQSASDPLPLTLAAGATRLLLAEGPHRFQAALDADYLVPEQNISLRAGGEYWFKRRLALRLGYLYSLQTSVNGFTAGFGVRFKFNRFDLNLDYALRPQAWGEGEIALENAVSLGMKF